MPRGERHRGFRETSFDRAANLRRLRSGGPFDVVVVGGGITGAGVALDAAARGLSAALVERDDFACGTSSKSSKLVHGGLRYLQQGDVRLVYEALHERQRLRRNAPHLVSVLPFLIPIFSRDGLMPKKVARALGTAMWMYDLTGGFRLGKLHKRLRADAAHAHMPTLPKERLSSAYLYYDATADDARLTLTIARTAAAHGAVVVNQCAVSGFLPDGGVAVTDRLADNGSGAMDGADGDDASDARFDVPARVVVNAAGVWSDEVRAMHESLPSGSIRPAKGVHITVPWHLIRNDVAVVIPVPGDKRSLFVVPWNEQSDGTFEHCYIGTTDTDYDGPIDEPQCTADDIAYVLRAINGALDPEAQRPVSVDDITATWAGLRPLVSSAAASGRTADLSRRHDVIVDGGIVSITGGKLTTYREMAEDAVDAVAEQVGSRARCRTKRLRLLGAPTAQPTRSGRAAMSDAVVPSTGDGTGGDDRWTTRLRSALARFVADTASRLRDLREARSAGPEPTHRDVAGHGEDLLTHLESRYGTMASDVVALIDSDPALGERLVPGLPYVRAEAVYAVQDEMATSLVDVLMRRTRAHLLDRAATRDAAPGIARLLAPHAGWEEATVARQIDEYDTLCRRELDANRASRSSGDEVGTAAAGAAPP